MLSTRNSIIFQVISGTLNLLIKLIFYTERVLSGRFNYDFVAISSFDFKISPLKDLLPKKRASLEFYHDSPQKSHINNFINVYSKTAIGLGRLIQRSNFIKMFRQFKLTPNSNDPPANI
jgi:hypothetical protein